MTVDIGALRKFQDLWGPVLESIPAVIEATAKKEDLDRAIAIQNKALEKAKQDVASAYDEADKRLAAVNLELEALMVQKTQTTDAIATERVKANEAAVIALQEAQAQLAAVNLKVQASTEKLNSIGADYAAKIAEAQMAHDAAVAKMDAEIKSLEDRGSKAEKALEALRAKLG